MDCRNSDPTAGTAQVSVLGICLTAQRFETAVAKAVEAASERTSFRAHFCTVHTLVSATANQVLADVFATASMVCTDGMPLVWLVRRRGYPFAERCAGPDVMLAVCDQGRALGLRHFFLGGAPGVADEAARHLAQRLPGLQVAGTASPPYRPLTDEELQSLAQTISSSGAHIVWIGLGSPKQELFAATDAKRFGSVVLLPVGAAFDFYAGRVRRAPVWMRRIGLEWLFRLLAEPRRLWRRYLVTNVRFAWLVFREEVSRRRAGS